MNYVAQCSGPVYKLVDYGHEDIRRAALTALTQFTICIGKQPDGEQGIHKFSDVSRKSVKFNQLFSLSFGSGHPVA